MIINVVVSENKIISPDYIVHPKCTLDCISRKRILDIIQKSPYITYFTFCNELCSIRLENSSDTHQVYVQYKKNDF